MSFAWPHLLWLLSLPAVLLLWDGLRLRRVAKKAGHDKILRAEAGASRASLASQNQIQLRRLPRLWLAAGLALACLALARPQWGQTEEQVFEQSREILIALDLSRSMDAPDIKPSRLARSKLLIESLLDGLKGERVGLVLFSGTAFLQCPLSTDYEIFRDMMPELKPGFLPEAGTNFAALLSTSLDAFGTTEGADRFLIILSDGEDLDDSWRPLIAKLKDRKIRILALGVGTDEGAMIPTPEGGFVKDERGAVVKTRLAPATLEQLARDTGGAYRDASTWVDLKRLLNETVDAGKQGNFSEKRNSRAIERYQWALGAALVCLFFSLYFDFPSRVRPRKITLANRAGRAALLLLALAFLSPEKLSALSTEKPAEAATPETPLVSTVKRLSAKPELRAGDCAELAKRSIDWGKQLQSAQQPIPEGPVRDALLGVDLGAKLDAKSADWASLRRELEALLRKPEEKKQDDQKNQNENRQNQKQNQQNDPQQNQDQQNQDKASPQNQQKQDQQQQQQQDQQDKSQQQQQEQKLQSAFDKMKDQQQPPEQNQQGARPEDMQQVGGQDRKQPQENTDPSMVIPLEKLERVKNQDSPARLFKLMEDDKKQPTEPSKKKTW